MESTDKPKTCPRCHGTMQPGFATDRSFAAMHPSSWVEGEAKPSTWVGTTLSERSVFSIVAYRCGACAFIELYAPAS